MWLTEPTWSEEKTSAECVFDARPQTRSDEGRPPRPPSSPGGMVVEGKEEVEERERLERLHPPSVVLIDLLYCDVVHNRQV